MPAVVELGSPGARDVIEQFVFVHALAPPFSGSHCRHLLGDEPQDLGESLRDVPHNNPFLIDEKGHRHCEDAVILWIVSSDPGAPPGTRSRTGPPCGGFPRRPPASP